MVLWLREDEVARRHDEPLEKNKDKTKQLSTLFQLFSFTKSNEKRARNEPVVFPHPGHPASRIFEVMKRQRDFRIGEKTEKSEREIEEVNCGKKKKIKRLNKN